MADLSVICVVMYRAFRGKGFERMPRYSTAAFRIMVNTYSKTSTFHGIPYCGVNLSPDEHTPQKFRIIVYTYSQTSIFRRNSVLWCVHILIRMYLAEIPYYRAYIFQYKLIPRNLAQRFRGMPWLNIYSPREIKPNMYDSINYP